MLSGGVENFPQGDTGKTRDLVANKLGIGSGKQYEKEKYIENNLHFVTDEIKVYQDNVCQGMIEIGKELIEIKKELGHGNWIDYLKNELGYSQSTAKNFIRIANDFGNLNRQTFSDLPSSKIIALLDVPQENRDDFIDNHNLEDSTVRELKKEIQKYKEENGLLTQRQQQALEEKRKKEQETLQLKQQLEYEKSKPPKVETKVVEKVVEKIVDNTDYKVL